MGKHDFNRKECIRALRKLGFSLSRRQRRGRHDKYCPPEKIANNLSGLQPRFIMIPRHKNLHCQNEILSELKKMGGEDLVEQFLNHL